VVGISDGDGSGDGDNDVGNDDELLLLESDSGQGG